MAVSPSGKIRDGIRQGRADARFVRGVWLDKTTKSDERLFANELGVYITRTVKRVPDTEQKRADLVKGLQGTLWNRLAARPAGKPRKTAPDATGVATPPAAKETERPSEDADLNPPAVPHVIRVLRATDTENEPSSPSSRPMETEDGSARDNTTSDRAQVRSPACCNLRWLPTRLRFLARARSDHLRSVVGAPEKERCCYAMARTWKKLKRIRNLSHGRGLG